MTNIVKIEFKIANVLLGIRTRDHRPRQKTTYISVFSPASWDTSFLRALDAVLPSEIFVWNLCHMWRCMRSKDSKPWWGNRRAGEALTPRRPTPAFAARPSVPSADVSPLSSFCGNVKTHSENTVGKRSGKTHEETLSKNYLSTKAVLIQGLGMKNNAIFLVKMDSKIVNCF